MGMENPFRRRRANRCEWQRRSVALVVLGVMLCAFSAPGHAESESKAERQAAVRKMARETLSRLYAAQPAAKAAIQDAAGHAVFSNFGMKIFVAGGGSGKGLAVHRASKKETFMKMVEVQAGLGFGVKKFRQVWIFENDAAFDEFVNSGWQLGGQATAGAKLGDEGSAFAGALSVAPGVWVYQLTDDGLALELTAKGTKYYKDDDLN